jgi:hypothetical protein
MTRVALLMLAIAAIGACAHRVPATSPYVWQLRGAVVTIQPDRLTVRHKSGQIVPIVIDDQTVFARGRERDSRASLTPGVRVMIDVETAPRHVYRARRVQIFARRP